jgi:NADPH-dependent curcumin reductase CurA
MDNRQFRLVRRPNGMPADGDFELAEAPLAPLAEGAFRVRNRFASLDPAIRGWLSDAPSYMPPVNLGDPVRATTIGVVEESRNPDFAPGDWVLGLNAIERFSTVQAGGFTQKVDVSAVPSPTNYLSVLGAVGMTAYFGLEDAGGVKPGETVLVSGAAGAVGSLVGQIAAIHGGRAVGIAGGPAKVARLTERYGYAVRHRLSRQGRSGAFSRDRGGVPGRANVVFENVGGTVLDAGADEPGAGRARADLRPHQRI